MNHGRAKALAMCTTVRYQGTLFCKALMFTRIWFMWLVRFHWKTFLTMFTLIWFLICMNTNVFCQGNLFSKPFLTMFTLVWLILCNVWIRLCLVRLLFTEKYFWQCSHWCVFSFVWIRMCSVEVRVFFLQSISDNVRTDEYECVLSRHFSAESISNNTHTGIRMILLINVILVTCVLITSRVTFTTNKCHTQAFYALNSTEKCASSFFAV